jgi:hypothetical protein
MKTHEQNGVNTTRWPAILSAAVWVLAAWATAFTGAGLAAARAADNPYCGSWALTLPGGWTAWLGIEEAQGQLKASLVWMDGTFGPLPAAKIEDGTLVMSRRSFGSDHVQTITATVEGDTLNLVQVTPSQTGQGEAKLPFTGRRLPPMPPAPKLSELRFGEAIELFNGRDLSGWRLSSAQAEIFNAKAGRLSGVSGQPLAYPAGDNGWSARDGMLVNGIRPDAGQTTEGLPKAYGSLRTDREFEDFNLTLEVRLPKQGLSGVFLRGVYEIVVADSYGQPLRSKSMGGVYSRVTPAVAAEKPGGVWQTLDITLVDRHVTVILNGTKTIDNAPVLGCTPWALWADVMRPGPIYLRGDKTSIEYRRLVLRPILK